MRRIIRIVGLGETQKKSVNVCRPEHKLCGVEYAAVWCACLMRRRDSQLSNITLIKKRHTESRKGIPNSLTGVHIFFTIDHGKKSVTIGKRLTKPFMRLSKPKEYVRGIIHVQLDWEEHIKAGMFSKVQLHNIKHHEHAFFRQTIQTQTNETRVQTRSTNRS